jgi:hypothetical protein
VFHIIAKGLGDSGRKEWQEQEGLRKTMLFRFDKSAEQVQPYLSHRRDKYRTEQQQKKLEEVQVTADARLLSQSFHGFSGIQL